MPTSGVTDILLRKAEEQKANRGKEKKEKRDKEKTEETGKGAKRKKDDEMRGVVQEAMELWSEMVREELENDAECARRLRGLK